MYICTCMYGCPVFLVFNFPPPCFLFSPTFLLSLFLFLYPSLPLSLPLSSSTSVGPQQLLLSMEVWESEQYHWELSPLLQPGEGGREGGREGGKGKRRESTRHMVEVRGGLLAPLPPPQRRCSSSGDESQWTDGGSRSDHGRSQVQQTLHPLLCHWKV